MKEGRKPEYAEKCPDDELQKVLSSKAPKFKPQPRLNPSLWYWWQARKTDCYPLHHTSLTVVDQAGYGSVSSVMLLSHVCLYVHKNFTTGYYIQTFNHVCSSLPWLLAGMKNCGWKVCPVLNAVLWLTGRWSLALFWSVGLSPLCTETAVKKSLLQWIMSYRLHLCGQIHLALSSSVCLSLALSFCLSVCLFLSSYVRLCVSMSLSLSLSLSLCQSVSVSLSLFLSLSLSLSLFSLSLCQSVSVSLSLSLSVSVSLSLSLSLSLFLSLFFATKTSGLKEGWSESRLLT